uniref:50S ribosomal protein L9, chloroplastic n=1 Tax=Tolypiocladia glomerulata TaxID=860646 RepID=A0A1Z1MVA4_9FLOR|nr:ribosomal protein L9 [Tolypiocladia glomerulata]ARW69822.1 ribosomal protein L9 [Tolypiocladia glomerulata]
MKRKITVIIKKNKNSQFSKEKIIKVSRGYAFNYLLPNNKGEIATKKKIKHIEMFNKIKQKKQEIDDVRINEIREKIKEIEKISLYKKIGENNFIFGSITDKEIKSWIENNTKIESEKLQIKLPEIKKIGLTEIEVQFKQNIIETIKLNILPINI